MYLRANKKPKGSRANTPKEDNMVSQIKEPPKMLPMSPSAEIPTKTATRPTSFINALFERDFLSFSWKRRSIADRNSV